MIGECASAQPWFNYSATNLCANLSVCCLSGGLCPRAGAPCPGSKSLSPAPAGHAKSVGNLLHFLKVSTAALAAPWNPLAPLDCLCWCVWPIPHSFLHVADTAQNLPQHPCLELLDENFQRAMCGSAHCNSSTQEAEVKRTASLRPTWVVYSKTVSKNQKINKSPIQSTARLPTDSQALSMKPEKLPNPRPSETCLPPQPCITDSCRLCHTRTGHTRQAHTGP